VVESAAISDGKNSKSWHMLYFSAILGDAEKTLAMFKDMLDYLISLNVEQNIKIVDKVNYRKLWQPLTIYVHNFSGFYAIFLLKILVTESNGFKINRIFFLNRVNLRIKFLQPTYGGLPTLFDGPTVLTKSVGCRENKFLVISWSIEIGLNKKGTPKYSIVKFMDSYLMIPITPGPLGSRVSQ
jgi:hypothetical protein